MPPAPCPGESETALLDQVPNVLACDVGNTAIHFAHVQGDQVDRVRAFRIGELSKMGQALAELWEQVPPPRKIAAGSVNPAGLRALEAAAAESTREEVLVIGRDLPLPIETDVADPGSVGVDRLCAAVAAFDRLGVPCVVADFGTAITVDCVNAEGVFLGGAILPGLDMAAASLSAGTAQLPRVKLSRPKWVYGKNTEQAIIGGVIYGARGALRGLVEAYATELGQWPVVIVTGSDAKWVCESLGESDLIQAIVPDLVLRGVAIAYYRTLLK
jgi:type III pantothenate kinase